MPKPIRKLRHWKQRYDPNARFICRRRMRWGGRVYESGDPIPAQLATNKGKLRRFWEAGRIELAEFATSGAAPRRDKPRLPAGAALDRRGSWRIVTLADGTEQRANGLEAYRGLLAELEVNDLDEY